LSSREKGASRVLHWRFIVLPSSVEPQKGLDEGSGTCVCVCEGGGAGLS
jgi:hypothetical protein